MPDTTPALPETPVTTPAWLLKLVSLLLPFVGLGADLWDPSGVFSGSTAKTAVFLVFLVIAAVIFVYHTGLAAIHAHGFHLAALKQFGAASQTELEELLAEAKPLAAALKPALDSIGSLTKLSSRVNDVEQTVASKINAAPETDKAAVTAVVREVLGGLVAPAPATPADGVATAVVDVAPAPDVAEPTPVDMAPQPAA